MDVPASVREWVDDQLADAEFGDGRRWARARQMLRRAAAAPAGRITEVFATSAERQGAYDFVQGSIPPDAIVAAFARASLRAVDGDEHVFVAVDGTSLTLTDRGKAKDFGSIGMRRLPTRGVKIMGAIGIDQRGTPVGLLDIVGWSRAEKPTRSRYVRRRAKQTETQRWVDAVERVSSHVDAVRAACRLWFLMDREADSADVLRALVASGHSFTVRANQDRRVHRPDSSLGRLRSHLSLRRVRGVRLVDVPAGPNRSARRAKLDVRFGEVVLDLPERGTDSRTSLRLHAVWARERNPPRGEKPLDWLLYTDRPVRDLADANAIVDSYCHRWRIEDFHRSWKSGHCHVEDTQLRSRDHVLRWATMLAAVAMRVERLKHLARNKPDQPASIELSAIEIQALRVEAQRIKQRNETIPDDLTIAQAVHWIARMGGYTGKSSGGPPGSITLGRGLERFSAWAAGFAAALKIARK